MPEHDRKTAHARTTGFTTKRLSNRTKRVQVALSSLLAGGVLLAASTATASPDAMRLHGAEVDSIKNVESISDWQTLDTKHLTLKINNAQSYLLTLDDQCMHLRGARMVGVSMTNQEIWADFDHVAADGWECRIDTITRLGRKRSW